jgi:hypothetical protein
MSFIFNFEEYLKEQSEMGRLNEIGDASYAPYDYTTSKVYPQDTIPKYSAYRFTTTSGFLYNLYIFCTGDQMEIEFTANGSSTIVTNAGEIFGVMATVTKIVKDFLATHNQKEVLKRLRIEPSYNYPNDRRRTKIYIEYIKKQLKPKNIEIKAYNNTDIILVEL